MKKIISLLVVIVMIATMATTAFAAKAGETVTVTFATEGNPGFVSYGAVINYPAEALELVEVKSLQSGSFAHKNGKIGFGTTENITGEVELFVATFKVAEDAKAGEYAVTATLDAAATVNADLEAVVFEIVGGVVTVEVEHVCVFGEWVVEKEATCIETGLKARYCECGAKETEEIPMIAHAWGDWYGVDDYYHCRECSVVKHDKQKEAHEWDETGLKCTVCGWEKDPTLDPVPGTGDITPVVVTSAFALIALVALAGYMLKRKFAL